MTELAKPDFNFQAAAPIGNAQNATALLESKRFFEPLMDILPEFFDEIDPEKHAKRLIRQAALAFIQNHTLRKCTQLSILDSMLHVAETGLSLGRQFGEAFLVPFEDTKLRVYNCTFMPGYRGLIRLAYQTGGIARIDADAVYEGEDDEEHFKFWQEETGPKLRHYPRFDVERSDEHIRLVYSRFTLMSGGLIVKVMTRQQVDRIRSLSKNAHGPAWTYHYGEMALKTVLKRGTKTLPQTPHDKAVLRLYRATDLDNVAGGFENGEKIEKELKILQAQKREDWAKRIDAEVEQEPPRDEQGQIIDPCGGEGTVPF